MVPHLGTETGITQWLPWGLFPHLSCLQEPRTGHSVSAAVSEVLNREERLLFWPLLSCDLLMEPSMWLDTLIFTCPSGPQISLHKAASPPVCAQDLQLHQLNSVPTAGLNWVRFLSSLQFMSTALMISGNRK